MERGFAKTLGYQAHWNQITGEIEDVAQIVTPSEGPQRRGDHPLSVFPAQPVGAADPHVKMGVVRQGGRHDTAGKRLDQQLIGLVAKRLPRLARALSAFSYQRIADVEGCVRPGTLGEVADHGGNPLLALDQQHVGGPDTPFEGGEVIGAAALVFGKLSRQVRDDSLGQPAPDAHALTSLP